MNFLTTNFELILTVLVFLTGVVCLVDLLVWAKARAPEQKQSWAVEYSRSFFPVLLLVWVFRSFLFQPYRVPTGSLEPTVMPGDFILVNQFSYGLRLPVVRSKLLSIAEPRVGQVALFHWPVNPNYVFVKRVIGTPGDHVIYKNKVLTVNGKQAKQVTVGKADDVLQYGDGWEHVPVIQKTENLAGIKHGIFVRSVGGELKDYDFVVPKDYYFMMGDNRDFSDDGRSWGFVPESNFVGKALFVWMSWDSDRSCDVLKLCLNKVRWNRIGRQV